MSEPVQSLSDPPRRPIASRWRIAPMVLFIGSLIALTTVALIALITPARIVTGLPYDPAVERAIAVLNGGFRVACGDLRFRSSLAGDQAPADSADVTPTSEQMRRLFAATRSLEYALDRHRRDPRLLAAIGHLDLAAQRYERAERHYRAALDRAPTYGEGRLGLGVALALRATIDDTEGHARAHRLEAIAHWASVPRLDPHYEVALYDRILVLAEVGRAPEAVRWATRYWEIDSTSAWAFRLKERMGTSRRWQAISETRH